MKSNYCLWLIILSCTMHFSIFSVPPQKLEETEIAEPLFGREKLQKLRKISLKQHASSRFNKYKRCLWAGPCTKQEMGESKRDFKRLAATILIAAGITWALRYQYKAVQAAEEDPGICFPLQWWRLTKKQGEKAADGLSEMPSDIKKAGKAIQKFGEMVDEEDIKTVKKELKELQANLKQAGDAIQKVAGVVDEVKKNGATATTPMFGAVKIEMNKPVESKPVASNQEESQSSEQLQPLPQQQPESWSAWGWRKITFGYST